MKTEFLNEPCHSCGRFSLVLTKLVPKGKDKLITQSYIKCTCCKRDWCCFNEDIYLISEV